MPSPIIPCVDDQQTYLLNGLLTRHFGLGRIVRFREVPRGRQTRCFELLTAQQQEYLVQLFSPANSADDLEFAAGAVNLLDEHRFSVMPFVHSKEVVFVAPGPQNQHLLVSLAPAGSALAAAQYTPHDISQVGLRLGWMHRLLQEVLPEPKAAVSLGERFAAFYAAQGAAIAEPLYRQLHGLLGLVQVRGWAHGDIQLASLLHDNDHQLRAVVDWGLLHWGSPLEDVVDAFVALAHDAQGNLDRIRGRSLLESYDSLVTIKRVAWTPVIAAWCAQRLLDQQNGRRPVPGDFASIMTSPERLAMAMAACM
jgi:Ser/Thr protein kinase RdoA (MazF antagonist)